MHAAHDPCVTNTLYIGDAVKRLLYLFIHAHRIVLADLKAHLLDAIHWKHLLASAYKCVACRVYKAAGNQVNVLCHAQGKTALCPL